MPKRKTDLPELPGQITITEYLEGQTCRFPHCFEPAAGRTAVDMYWEECAFHTKNHDCPPTIHTHERKNAGRQIHSYECDSLHYWDECDSCPCPRVEGGQVFCPVGGTIQEREVAHRLWKDGTPADTIPDLTRLLLLAKGETL